VTTPGLILVAHGSSDPDWRRPLERVEAVLIGRLGPRVALAYLAHAPTIEDAARALVEVGHTHLVVVAALLSPGGRHVKRDIPAAVEQLRAAMPEIVVELRDGALGDDGVVIEALAEAALRRLS
jgi:sirohydrochlorin cobaltochelatase